MLKIGYRIRLRSRKGPDREGVVTAVTGSMLRVRWRTQDETTIIPAPGTLTVLAPAPPQQAAAKKTAAKKKAAKKAVPKKAATKKTATKKTAAKKTAKKAAPGTGGPNSTTRARRSSR